jgi:enamine deaminase RidA (YjgF/YER057c/UK114 family)
VPQGVAVEAPVIDAATATEEVASMSTTRQITNPWTWQDQFGFVQANTVTAQRLVFCAGQASIDADGNPVHAGDLSAQLTRAFDNLETVLNEAGVGLSDVVRLDYYTTDVDGLLAKWEIISTRLAEANCRPASTLLGVSRLAFPEMLVEIEATAVTT